MQVNRTVRIGYRTEILRFAFSSFSLSSGVRHRQQGNSGWDCILAGNNPFLSIQISTWRTGLEWLRWQKLIFNCFFVSCKVISVSRSFCLWYTFGLDLCLRLPRLFLAFRTAPPWGWLSLWRCIWRLTILRSTREKPGSEDGEVECGDLRWGKSWLNYVIPWISTQHRHT